MIPLAIIALSTAAVTAIYHGYEAYCNEVRRAKSIQLLLQRTLWLFPVLQAAKATYDLTPYGYTIAMDLSVVYFVCILCSVLSKVGETMRDRIMRKEHRALYRYFTQGQMFVAGIVFGLCTLAEVLKFSQDRQYWDAVFWGSLAFGQIFWIVMLWCVIHAIVFDLIRSASLTPVLWRARVEVHDDPGSACLPGPPNSAQLPPVQTDVEIQYDLEDGCMTPPTPPSPTEDRKSTRSNSSTSWVEKFKRSSAHKLVHFLYFAAIWTSLSMIGFSLIIFRLVQIFQNLEQTVSHADLQWYDYASICVEFFVALWLVHYAWKPVK